LQAGGFRSALLLPLTTAVHNVGVLAFIAHRPGTYSQAELELLAPVADQVAVAVDNALHSARAGEQQIELTRERDRWRVLLEVTNALVSTLDLVELLDRIAPSLKRVVEFDIASLDLYDAARHVLQPVVQYPAFESRIVPTDAVLLEDSAVRRAFESREPLLIDDIAAADLGPKIAAIAGRRGLKSGCAIPLVGPQRTIGAFVLAARQPGRFAEHHLELLLQVGRQIAIAVENALAYQRVAELTDRLAREKRYLEDEIRGTWTFEEIVGRSPALRRALALVEDAAPTDTTVLLLGETGTGKELFARAVHNLSPRRDRTLVKVNCAAIPSGLLESELFGHEKGAFTGALDRKIGRFELADGGTLLLDEVGDIPLDLQTKLLRVLQEREFERLGSTRSLKVDVRVIAATNQDLKRLVGEQRFRSDLYYRLNVFPIAIPPLRERRGDVPLLVKHFVEKHARRLKRPIDRIPTEAIDALERWTWPGNVRELESVIERAVIRSRNGVLHIPLGDLQAEPDAESRDVARLAPGATLEAMEREHILRTLADTHWVIGGPRGAASRLGMKRTTLVSRMRKLGIARPVP
jgi:formate hydrogenlyase transcriptional activator